MDILSCTPEKLAEAIAHIIRGELGIGVAEYDHSGAPSLFSNGARNCRPQHRDQFFHVQRLGKGEIGAIGQRLVQNMLVAAADHADVHRQVLGSDFAQHFHPRAIGEHDVQQNPFGQLHESAHRFGNGRGFRHGKALAAQDQRDQSPGDLVVLHQQHRSL